MKIKFTAHQISGVLSIAIWFVVLLFDPLIVKAQNTAFTYQGKLTDAGSPASGQYDLQFKLYDVPGSGTLLGTLVKDDVQVTGGIFTVTLDFGADVFYTNAGRYLEIGVRPGASTGAFTTLTPRQELTASPYAIESARAGKAGDAQNLGGAPPSSYLRSNIDQTFTGGNLTTSPSSVLDVQGALFGSGANLTNLNASHITNGSLADARLSGNVALLNAYNIFTGGVQFNSPPIGSGEFLTNLTASNLTGTIPDARLSNNIPRLGTGNTFFGANNNFTGQISVNALNVGGGLPVTKILTASATLDFGNGGIYQEVLGITVLGARVGDAVYLGIPANLFPLVTRSDGSTITQPLTFQAFVSSANTVSVIFLPHLFPLGDVSGGFPPSCLDGSFDCVNPPPGVFRVVVFSFAP
jgi:hypothetical protein